MKLSIVAIGRPGRGPEATLADDYAKRATLSGRALGLGPLELIDLEARKPGKAPEAELLLAAAEGAHARRDVKNRRWERQNDSVESAANVSSRSFGGISNVTGPPPAFFVARLSGVMQRALHDMPET